MVKPATCGKAKPATVRRRHPYKRVLTLGGRRAWTAVSVADTHFSGNDVNVVKDYVSRTYKYLPPPSCLLRFASPASAALSINSLACIRRGCLKVKSCCIPLTSIVALCWQRV